MTDEGPASDALFAGNWLASRVPVECRDLLVETARIEHMPRKRAFDAAELSSSVIFPLTGTVVTLATLIDDRRRTVAVLGSEGAFGALGAYPPISYEATVELPGDCLMLDRQLVARVGVTSSIFRDALARSRDCLLAQSLQSTACRMRHGAYNRLADLLIALEDLQGAAAVRVTQATLANLLGVQRTTVSAAAAELQRVGLISSVRGRVEIADRAGLQREACQCWPRVKQHYERLLT